MAPTTGGDTLGDGKAHKLAGEIAAQIAYLTPTERDQLARIMVRDMGADLFGPAGASLAGAMVGGAREAYMRQAGEYDAAPSKQQYTPGGYLEPCSVNLDNVEEAFRYQPWDSGQMLAGDAVRELLTFAAKGILRNVPNGPLRTRALNHLIDARMIANAAITFRGRF